MSCAYKAVCATASSRQSTPVAVARSSSGSSTSVTFEAWRTCTPASRHARTSRSNAIAVAA